MQADYMGLPLRSSARPSFVRALLPLLSTGFSDLVSSSRSRPSKAPPTLVAAEAEEEREGAEVGGAVKGAPPLSEGRGFVVHRSLLTTSRSGAKSTAPSSPGAEGVLGWGGTFEYEEGVGSE